jgi:SAM-dependent methyltransferase
MRADYSEVFQNTAAVEKYDDVQYAPDSHSTAVNARQRRYLRRLVRDAFPLQRPVQHDFACGTGRAVELLHGLVRDAHGYDTSELMIERARNNGRHAHWHVIRPDGPVPAPMPVNGVAIVTVFRLLLNVDDKVRDRAVAFAARALPTYTSGLLVLQNHGSARSLRHLRAGRNADNPWFAELSDATVLDLLDRHGFSLVGRRGFAMFPKGAYEAKLTRPLVRALDNLLCASRVFDKWAVDVLYIARRDRPTAPTEWDERPVDCAGPEGGA